MGEVTTTINECDSNLQKSKDLLWDTFQDFIKRHDITCEEVIYQLDWVNSELEELVTKSCNIVGFIKYED